MEKFCGNCGAEMGDNAKVCGQCGTPLRGTSSTQITRAKFNDPVKKKKNKKIITLCVTALVLVIITFVSITMISTFTGYNGLIRKVMTAYKDYDIDTLIYLSSDMYYYGAEDYVEYYFEYNVGSALDSFETSIGHNYKITYEINEIYTLPERNLKEILEEISYGYSEFDTGIIQKFVGADITVTAKQGNKSVSRDLKIIMSKEKGSWKLLYIE